MLQTLPKDMVLSHALPPTDVNWVWIPDAPLMVPTPFRYTCLTQYNSRMTLRVTLHWDSMRVTAGD